jgi:NADH:ubiquinone oxidoreductase subunit F (NADH-binding)
MSAARVLAGTDAGTLSLGAHHAVHGPPGDRADLLDAVARSGLRGRGGASFPTAVKLQGAARHRGPRTVLVNGAEGEPLSAKDRVLMELAPHLVLDGALAAARAIDARHVVFGVRGDAAAAMNALNRAIDERGVRRRVRVASVPTAYLAGQEMALISHLDGGPLRPRVVPPLPVERGLSRRPTLVQNPETLAHVALIDRHGPEWFRAIGTDEHPGTALITLAGAVHHPGVLEVACGTLFDDAVRAAGGATEPLQAALVGGYHGVWVPAEGLATLRLDDGTLATWGGTMAAGVTVAVGESACVPREVAGVMGWLAGQIAGQCGPCTHGMPAIAQLLEQVVGGTSMPGAREQLERWGTELLGRGACHLPDGSVRFLASALRTFGSHFADHARTGPCPNCRRPLHLVPAGAARRRAA